MNTPPKSKGPWTTRLGIKFFTVILAVLIYWMLGFFVQDIRSIDGQDYNEIRDKYVSKELTEKDKSINTQIDDLTRRIKNQKESQDLVQEGSRSLQQTINQLLELQKLSLEKNLGFSESQQASFITSLNLFMENQKKYQKMNDEHADLLAMKRDLEEQKVQTTKEIEKQNIPANKEIDTLSKKHRMKLAFLQLLVLVPLLAVAVLLIFKKRGSIYFPLLVAFGVSTLVKVGFVVHEYFPSMIFKYVLIVSLLLAVGRVLVYFIRVVAFPKKHWLVKQYREAYERFLCPVCEYPIRTGPRRFLFWTRRTVNKIVLPNTADSQDESYTCPNCGTQIFEECPTCHKQRHALLPYCEHCGAEKSFE